MAGGFKHEVLGEINADEYFWIFPKKVAAYFVVGMGAAFISGKLFGFNPFGIGLAIIIAVTTIVLCLLAIIIMPAKEYIKGGGISHLDIITRKFKHKKRKKLMSLCAELPDEK